MKNRDFYITGESFGGVFEPSIAAEIIEYNKKVEDEEEKIPLKAVFIGNTYIEMLNHAKIYGFVPISLGFMPFESIPQLEVLKNRCMKDWNSIDKYPESMYTCIDIDKYLVSMNGGFDIYDFRYPSSNVSQQKADINDYLNMRSVIEELHMSESTKSPKFTTFIATK